jgi:hypothetical protein
LRQTSEQVSRLEQIFEQLAEKPSGRKCLGMEGPVKEGAETMKEDYVDEVKDAAIIGAAQQVEHYEIAGTERSEPLPSSSARTIVLRCWNRPWTKKSRPTRS